MPEPLKPAPSINHHITMVEGLCTSDPKSSLFLVGTGLFRIELSGPHSGVRLGLWLEEKQTRLQAWAKPEGATWAQPPVGPPPAGGTIGVECNVCWAVARSEGLAYRSRATKTSEWDMESHLSGR